MDEILNGKQNNCAVRGVYPSSFPSSRICGASPRKQAYPSTDVLGAFAVSQEDVEPVPAHVVWFGVTAALRLR